MREYKKIKCQYYKQCGEIVERMMATKATCFKCRRRLQKLWQARKNLSTTKKDSKRNVQ